MIPEEKFSLFNFTMNYSMFFARFLMGQKNDFTVFFTPVKKKVMENFSVTFFFMVKKTVMEKSFVLL